MLNTQFAQDRIVVTDNEETKVATITYDCKHESSYWVVILEGDFDTKSRLDIVKAFKSRHAAEYYVLAAYIEATA